MLRNNVIGIMTSITYDVIMTSVSYNFNDRNTEFMLDQVMIKWNGVRSVS